MCVCVICALLDQVCKYVCVCDTFLNAHVQILL